MEKGRRREFHLPALLGIRVELRDAREDLHVDGEHTVFFLLGKIAPLALHLRQLGIQPRGREAAPREIVPDLQIAELVRVPMPQLSANAVALKICAAFCVKLRVAREWPEQIVVLDFEEVLQDREPLIFVEVRRGFA